MGFHWQDDFSAMACWGLCSGFTVTFCRQDSRVLLAGMSLCMGGGGGLGRLDGREDGASGALGKAWDGAAGRLQEGRC